VGRHSSPERTPFIRSLGVWALPWLLIAAVLVIALVVVFDMVGEDPTRPAASGGDVELVDTSNKDDSDGGPEAKQPEKDPRSEEDPDPEEKPEKESERREKEDGPKLITDGIEVQVLNGTAAAEADDLVADRLDRLGYTVVAVSPSSRGYAQTVVFWTGDAQRVGEVLAERFDWDVEPAPSNLSPEVHLHVVVGEDSL
jgi:hypothetical protein